MTLQFDCSFTLILRIFSPLVELICPFTSHSDHTLVSTSHNGLLTIFTRDASQLLIHSPVGWATLRTVEELLNYWANLNQSTTTNTSLSLCNSWSVWCYIVGFCSVMMTVFTVGVRLLHSPHHPFWTLLLSSAQYQTESFKWKTKYTTGN